MPRSSASHARAFPRPGGCFTCSRPSGAGRAWREELEAEAPFDLVFVDATPAKHDGGAVLGLLAPGGMVVLDDFWERPTPDPVRDFWLEHPDLTSTELFLTAEMTAIVAVRVR